MDFSKKFNIGLTLDTNFREYQRFIEDYHPYIHSVYFSPPLGRKFHTRTKTALQLMSPEKKRLFWRQLSLLRQYGIELELLMNSLHLSDELIARAAEEFNRRGLEPDSVCFLEKYYPAVQRCFPRQRYIWSFNNGFRSRKRLDAVIDSHRVDAVVLGSSFIRNSDLFAHLAERGTEVYLLLNNGCSFNCPTCNNDNPRCKATFVQNRKTHSVAYLYALQSIFPCELTDGSIDCTNVSRFKISNRSSDVAYVRNVMDSYLHSQVRCYVQADPNSYAYWGRAGFFWKQFASLQLEDVIAEKQKILRHELDVR